MSCARPLPQTLIFLKQGLATHLGTSRASGSKEVPGKYLLINCTFLLCTQIRVHLQLLLAALWTLGKALATR